jgi:hypothetical protein
MRGHAERGMVEEGQFTDKEERKRRRAFAYHEAGHAVLGWALGCEVRSASTRAAAASVSATTRLREKES